jgi:hypothetical protein
VASHVEYVLSGVFTVELLVRLLGTHFTCFTDTKAQILTQKALLAYHPRAFAQSNWYMLDCVLVLASVVAAGLAAAPPQLQVHNLLALLVQ